MTVRATEASSTARAARVHRSLLFIAAISAMLMPSNYRGGAEPPHPHGFFQFWLSEPERAHDHHGHVHEQRHRDAGSPELLAQRVLSGATNENAAIEHLSNDEPAFFDTSKMPLVESPEDRPSVSPAVAPGSAASVIPSAFPGSWDFATTVRRVRFSAFTPGWVEFLSSPEPPPPRLRMSFS
jgi:hypothetical protein